MLFSAHDVAKEPLGIADLLATGDRQSHRAKCDEEMRDHGTGVLAQIREQSYQAYQETCPHAKLLVQVTLNFVGVLMSHSIPPAYGSH